VGWLGGMTIREFAPADDAAWAAMRAKLWPHAAAELAREARDFAQGMPLPNVSAVFIAQDGPDAAIGFLELALRSFSDGCESMPVPHVEGWYVEPHARGKGVGRALMRAAEAWSTQRGFKELASDTELDNTASLQVHQRCGFQEVERLIKLRKKLGHPQK
jgi:aminoglycoside 6'-N-acetyltransferase I